MQNKGFISTIAVLLILICGFYISFSFVTSHYEKKAEEYAAKTAGTSDVTNDAYKQSLKQFNDSIDKEKVADPYAAVDASMLLNGKYLLVQRGKKNYYLLIAK